MKILTLSVTLLLSLLMLSSCGDDDDDDEPEELTCTEQFQEVFFALEDFLDDESECSKYAEELQKYIDNGCDVTSSSRVLGEIRLTTETAQTTLDGLDCN